MKKLKYIEQDGFYERKFEVKHSEANIISKALHKLLPLNWQYALRDSGGIQWINNISATVIGFLLVLTNPRLLIDYYNLTMHTRRYCFDHTDPSHFIDVVKVDTENTPNKNSTKNSKKNNNSHRFFYDREDPKALIFVYGGAWGSGHTWMYRLCAARAARALNASYAVLIEYSTYPKAVIDDQVKIVSQAITFVANNPSIIFPGDNSWVELDITRKLILMGHSSGANISALVVHHHAMECKRCIDYFIALSGVFDISEHYLWEEERGLHEVSPMSRAAISFENFNKYSPTVITKELDHHKYSQDYPMVLFIHGISDTTVPVTSSVEYAKSLRKHLVHICAAFPEYDHMNPILDLTLSSKSITALILEEYYDMMTSDSHY